MRNRRVNKKQTLSLSLLVTRMPISNGIAMSVAYFQFCAKRSAKLYLLRENHPPTEKKKMPNISNPGISIGNPIM